MNTTQGTPAWFNARKGKLTASKFGAAAGICPYTSRHKLLRREFGIEKFDGNLDACRWGTANEKNAIKDYMVRTGNIVTSKGFFPHPDHDWLGGSPDGLVGDEGMIEVKCPFVNKVCHTKIPPVYYCQINGLLEILNRQWCDYISWTPTAMKVYRVYRDPELFAYLMDRYTLFYACMKRGCDTLPRMGHGEKDEVLKRIADSDQFTEYDFWSYCEPGAQKGRWEGPPNDPFESESDESPSSKRPREDGSTDACKLRALSPGSADRDRAECDDAGPGPLHSGGPAEPGVHELLSLAGASATPA